MDAARLSGKRVLVLRPRERAESLCFLLEDEGAEVVLLPLLELVPPKDPRPLSAAAEQLHRYKWVLFASPSAVDAFVEAVREAGTGRNFSLVKLGAVGPATANALRSAGLKVEAQAEDASGQGLYLAVQQSLQPGDQILLPAAEEGRRELHDALAAAGLPVTRVAAYRSAELSHDSAEVAAAFDPMPDVAIFGSPRTVDAFVQLPRGADFLQRSPAVAIGPTTRDALEEKGAKRIVQSQAPTAEALVDAAIAATR